MRAQRIAVAAAKARVYLLILHYGCCRRCPRTAKDDESVQEARTTLQNLYCCRRRLTAASAAAAAVQRAIDIQLQLRECILGRLLIYVYRLFVCTCVRFCVYRNGKWQHNGG